MMSKIASIGGFIAVAGIASIALYFAEMNLKILMWIDSWGPQTGWIIRIGLVVVGGILFAVGKFAGKE